jgi:hypothetical protein
VSDLGASTPSAGAAGAQGPRPPLFRANGKRKLALTGIILLLLGLVGFRGTYAAWVVTDSNTSTLATNTITINDNQGGSGGATVTTGTALINVSNLEPGSSANTACIGVNFSGTATVSSLTLQAVLGGAGQTALQGQLTMTTATYNTTGTVSTPVPPASNNNGSCTNYPGSGTNTTVGTQGATLSTWATGGPYTISSPVTNTWYKFTISGLPSGDTNCVTYCGQTITVQLIWTLTTT